MAGLPADGMAERGQAVNAVCPVCGALPSDHPVGRRIIKRGALTLRSDPLELWWNDRLVPLSPLEASLMEPLMRRGRIAWKELETQLGISSDTRVTLMHRIRQKFRAAGAKDPLETVRSWGLRLRVEADFRQSTAIWIGADEASEAHLFSAAQPGGSRPGHTR